jgi:hypothetical protein
MAIMNIKQAKSFLLHSPIEIATLISGHHGIGKSAIVKQIANTLGVSCIDFRLAQNDVGDLKGIPYMVNGRTVFAPPEFFPIREADAIELKDLLNLTDDVSRGRYGDKGILFLDEINRANREVQQAAFELVLDRRLNLRSLPDGWRVVAALNGDDSIYSVVRMEPAFLSRFALIDLKPTVEEWFSWAENEGKIHTAITQFIRKHNDMLDPTEEMLKQSSLQGVVKVHDRRAWEMFSKTLNKYEDDYNNKLLPNHPLAKTQSAFIELISLAGCFVGNMASIKFKDFIEQDFQTLNADIIINNFNNDVENRIKKLADQGKIPELAAYNEMIVAFIQHSIAKKLSLKQKKNLTSYLQLLPKEIIGDFWDVFNREATEIAVDWYNHDIKTTKINCKLITNALSAPKRK